MKMQFHCIRLRGTFGTSSFEDFWQSISLAFGAVVRDSSWNIWKAVFADVGLILLAVLNAVRIQQMSFPSKGNGSAGG